MLTDDGSIKTANIGVGPALWLYRKKLTIIAVLLLIAGACGLIAYVSIKSVFDIRDGEAPQWVDAFLVFALPFAFGLVGCITLKRLKSREKQENRTGECVFYADCFFFNYKTAVQLTEKSEKFIYSDAVLKSENEKYGYVFVSNKGLFLAFSKEGLEEGELNAIRKLFKKPVSGETKELKNYKTEEEIN